VYIFLPSIGIDLFNCLWDFFRYRNFQFQVKPLIIIFRSSLIVCIYVSDVMNPCRNDQRSVTGHTGSLYFEGKITFLPDRDAGLANPYNYNGGHFYRVTDLDELFLHNGSVHVYLVNVPMGNTTSVLPGENETRDQPNRNCKMLRIGYLDNRSLN
jgi:hypothetical protein